MYIYTVDLLISGSHFQPMTKIHLVNNPPYVLKSQSTNSSDSKKRNGSKISLPNQKIRKQNNVPFTKPKKTVCKSNKKKIINNNIQILS